MPALIGHTHAVAPLAWRNGRLVDAAQYLADVARVAALLPERGPVLNLCADRYRFAVGFGAALLRRHTSLLPPTHSDAVVEQLRLEHPALYLLSDQPPRALQLPQLAYPPETDTTPTGATSFRVPEIEADFIAAQVFTSGSTGRPTAHAKSWGRLVLNARAEHARLAIHVQHDGACATLVGTVPAQHMYGFESSVLLALHNGWAFDASHPFYPADIAAALHRVPAARVLVTTPFHLRALLDSELVLPPLALLLCATAPLAPQLAQRAEAALQAPLLEIYGCTEAGQLATRRTVQGARWHTFDGVRLHENGARCHASGGHVEGVVPLSDRLELHGETEFTLLGRDADMVNIAGRRTSLAHLNHQLNSIAGVRDGAFHLPAAAPDEGLAEAVQRPIAFVVAPELTPAALLAALRSRIDAAFLPRPLHFVAELPRNSTGKLPTETLAALARQLGVAERPEP